MKRFAALMMVLAMVMCFAQVAAAENVSLETLGREAVVFADENATEYPLFEIQKLIMDEDHHVTKIQGVFTRIVDGDEEVGYVYSEAAPMERVELQVADNFVFIAPTDMEDVLGGAVIEDLYTWYIDFYRSGEPIEGREMTFACDDPVDGDYDFWFMTTRISVNGEGVVEAIEFAFVPWM